MKTYQPKEKEIKRNWHLIDAKGKVLGRLSSEVSKLLIGKHKVSYSPHMDSGDYVVVTNISGIILTGKKEQQKLYRSHSGYPGGFKEVSFSKMFSEFPERVLQKSVLGMLPNNRLKSKRIKRLKIFKDSKHPYADKLKN